MKSDRTLLKWYRKINKFFDGQLPDNVCVRWANEDEKDESEDEKYYGWCDVGEGRHAFEIVLSLRHNQKLTGRLSTLAHECCHVATALRDDHGPAFERWRQHISDRGIFKKSALVKGLTLF